MKLLRWVTLVPLAGLLVFAAVVLVRWQLAVADVQGELKNSRPGGAYSTGRDLHSGGLAAV